MFYNVLKHVFIIIYIIYKRLWNQIGVSDVKGVLLQYKALPGITSGRADFSLSEKKASPDFSIRRG